MWKEKNLQDLWHNQKNEIMGNMCDMTLCKKHKAGIDSCIKANKCYIQC